MEEKIFGIGLTRTGTASLTHAMTSLGYKSLHCPKDINIVSEYDFLSDMFITNRYKFLDCLYPNAKFIITIRDLASWLESNEEHFKNSLTNSFRREQSILAKENMFDMYNTIEFNRVSFESKYFSHLRDVSIYFKGREKKLLHMNVCAGDGWVKLCKFLNKSVPDCSFPNVNKKFKCNKDGTWCW